MRCSSPAHRDGPTGSRRRNLRVQISDPNQFDTVQQSAPIVEVNRRRGRKAPEFELVDALRDAFEAQRYFDVYVEYAKADQEALRSIARPWPGGVA